MYQQMVIGLRQPFNDDRRAVPTERPALDLERTGQ
jgi:hypothetical protein